MKHMKTISKALSLFFVLLILLSCFPTSIFAVDYGLIEVSDVWEDLKKFGITYANYPYDPDAKHCRMLHFLEYGYDYNGNTADYGLYVYLYNPSGKPIDLYSQKHYIQMQTVSSSGISSGFSKYPLSICSYSTQEGYKHVFYKFRVDVDSSFMLKVDRGMRKYDISGIEVLYSGELSGKDFKVGGTYSYTGYMAYHGADKSQNDSLQHYVNDRITVDLELHPVTWKTKTSDKGAGMQYEMFSVYFAVPNDVIRDYGNVDDPTKGLVQVDGSFEEYKLNGLITDDPSFYDEVKQYLGKKVVFDSFYKKWIMSAVHLKVNYDASYPFAVIAGQAGVDAPSDKYWNYGIGEVPPVPSIDSMTFALQYSGSEFNGISSTSFLSEFNAFRNELGYFYAMKEKDMEQGTKRGFQYYSVSNKDAYGNSIDLSNKIASFASRGDNKFVAWLRGDADLIDQDEVYSAITPIIAVDAKDLTSLNSVGISNAYFMQESEASDFRSFVNTSSVSFKTPYLMRFAVRDYYCHEAEVDRSDGTWKYNDGSNYYFEKTIFLNFDILSLTYENKYSEKTVIPVVADPIDIVGTVTPPPDGKNPNEKKPGPTGGCAEFMKEFRFNWVIVILVALLVLWALTKFGSGIAWLFRGIFAILSAPFRLIGKGVEASRNQSEERRRSNEERRRENEESRREREESRKEDDRREKVRRDAAEEQRRENEERRRQEQHEANKKREVRK